jgi:hypothetical protein
MPLDGHAYLLDQGWKGKGTGLRQGAIAAPLVVHQKKNLAGLGKDRDDAFPFWDQFSLFLYSRNGWAIKRFCSVFAAAAKSIRITVDPSDDEGSTSTSSMTQTSPHQPLARTTTGILSNRRPTSGAPITTDHSSCPGSSLLAAAKREAAKKGLYAGFCRGPVLGPALVEEVDKELSAVVQENDARTGGKKRKKRAPPEEPSKKRRKKRRSSH